MYCATSWEHKVSMTLPSANILDKEMDIETKKSECNTGAHQAWRKTGCRGWALQAMDTINQKARSGKRC